MEKLRVSHEILQISHVGDIPPQNATQRPSLQCALYLYWHRYKGSVLYKKHMNKKMYRYTTHVVELSCLKHKIPASMAKLKWECMCEQLYMKGDVKIAYYNGADDASKCSVAVAVKPPSVCW